MDNYIFIAHLNEEGKEQKLVEHLVNVANLCSNVVIDELKPYAYIIGLLHDIGKYSNAFQRRIRGDDIAVEHSISGAKEVINIYNKNLVSYLMSYCIAGHHTGLPDGGSKSDLEEEGTLSGRLKRDVEDFSSYKNELIIKKIDTNSFIEFFINKLEGRNDNYEFIEKYAFLVRYLFSCLTDADFIDTERFCNYVDREIEVNFPKGLVKINNEISSKKCETKVQKSRGLLQSQAFSKVNEKADIYLLNMPTGSGKTFCSMKFALERLIRTKKKRIIYVIPYTSIIEQTAETFEKIFGNDIPILQHHSNYFYDGDLTESDEQTTKNKLKKATENWDAPLIITTNIQFFQSIYHYKGSKLRKLHNMADSIIVFDEIHLMPVDFLQPCLRAIGYITNLLNSEALFLTATMPNYKKLFDKYIPNAKVVDLVEDKSLFPEFNTSIYKYLGKCSLDSIIERASQYKSSLIIVNNRNVAKEMYSRCMGNKYHLSTYMTNIDRSIVIKKIRNDLEKGIKITVISTSLIEAGVDLDFESVFRELAGLDSIIQSGGRCNREGESDKGYVYIFEREDSSKRQSDLSLRSNVTRSIIKDNMNDNGEINISSSACIESYYEQIYEFNSKAIRDNSIANMCNHPENIPFRTYAEKFNMIDSDTIAIVIDRDEESQKLIQDMKYGSKSAKRKLQKYTATVYVWEFEKLYEKGVLDDYDTGVFCLTNTNYYKCDVGLQIDYEENLILKGGRL